MKRFFFSGLTSCQIVGHIIYVNLRDSLQPYKSVIGQVLLESSARIELIVTKTNVIENKFRNLDLEILAGDPNAGFVVTVKENGCSFNLDFSKVYWNPRLSTEHERIVNLVERNDIVFDVMAGVGPFAIPIAKKGQKTKKKPDPIFVYANDLNPSSFEYLKKNVRLNNLQEDFLKTYNLDGGEFIREKLPEVLEKFYKDETRHQNLHVLMNLPALAVTFLPNFKNLVDSEKCNEWQKMGKNLPLLHVYAFHLNGEELMKECCNILEVDEIQDMKSSFVRNVAPKKDMFRITIPLNFDILQRKSDSNEPAMKKQKIDD